MSFIVWFPFVSEVAASVRSRAQGAQCAEAAVLDRRLAQAEVGGGLGDAAVLPVPQHHHGAVGRRRAGQRREQGEPVGWGPVR